MARQDDTILRKRFDGVLDAAELARARAAGTELAYCPLQQGWVPLAADEEGDLAPPLSWHVGRLPLFKQVPGRPVHPRPESLTLRVWVEDDLPIYRALLCDPSLWTWMLEDRPARLDDDTCRALIALSTEGTHHKVRVATLGGRPVGQVRLEYGADPAAGELSYWLGAAARGRGLGRQMVRRFLDRLAVQQPGIRRITARVHPGNRASVRLLEACGFRACDRAELGLAPRGRDDGSWLGFLRRADQGAGTSSELSP
ncbi:GNAT family N-acetyltransferase [Rhodobacter calidifons]|uniref:GNAT family N-acetyltransferase n=1 Tax=Rhodobacter calidifons TaxID=2715277 RepID=A0ABX0G6F2_9RHOB|nr:GNAT family N-acetyltransferase [Rhodobacter calidifons]NHB76790.1 GNAT family N-acetyltransferase [Rhodobacter calidifons]